MNTVENATIETDDELDTVSDQSSAVVGFGDIFDEPAGFRPATPPPTFHKFERINKLPNELNIKLIGSHSLWSHCLWNAGVFLAKHFDNNPDLVNGKNVLELGAAASLPSFIAAANNAKKVVITDYPDAPIIDAILENAKNNLPEFLGKNKIFVKGYLWGQEVNPLLNLLNPGEKFDLVIMSDLIFNHSEHIHLLETATKCLSEKNENNNPEVLVAFSSHRPWLAEKDLNFFNLAQKEPFNFHVEHLFDTKMNAMFPEDPGDLEIRETVKLYRMTR
ncbi:nicotinamide n-methyltransferase [Clydaea vesicula]|uniref:Nicotinamide n-methyltransferase n=1 Tax=Clydaea vesicula TaxID=447962 RepID=A0AAD5U3I1_9FUNG|nr:nicotinamide n-methyltransferase [Clydaea vesicula]KAJ3387186.1 nicotinamide n-methyltransferase [Lobulomyces angularis]